MMSIQPEARHVPFSDDPATFPRYQGGQYPKREQGEKKDLERTGLALVVDHAAHPLTLH